MVGPEERLQRSVAREPHRVHHAVGADRHDTVGRIVGDRLLAELARRIEAHRLDDVGDDSLVLRPARLEARRLVAAPYDDVGRGLDLLDLVAVDHALVAREVEDLAAGLAEGLPDREQHGVAETAPRQHDRLARLDFGRRTGRAHDDHRLVGLQKRTEIGRAAHLECDQRQQALVLVDPCPGQRQALHGERRAPGPERARLVVLQAVELSGLEVPRCRRRLDDHFDDGGRQPVDANDLRPPLAVRFGQDLGRRALRGRQRRHRPRQHRIALLGAAHRLHDVAGERRMQVAEERHEAVVGVAVHQHAHLRGLRHALGRRGIALLVERAKVLAVDEGVRRILARQHGVGLRAGGHEDGARRQDRLDLCTALLARNLERLGLSRAVDLDGDR